MFGIDFPDERMAEFPTYGNLLDIQGCSHFSLVSRFAFRSRKLPVDLGNNQGA